MLLERDLVQSVGFRNVRKGGDDTSFATADGVVLFAESRGRKLIEVLPE